MNTSSLILTVAPEKTLGRFTVTWDKFNYSIEFRPEMDVILGDLLRRLSPILVGGRDSSKNLSSFELLRTVGTQLWHALFPEDTPSDKSASLAQELRTGMSPLLLVLPQSLSGLPWELLCDPLQPDDAAFLGRRRPLVRLIPGGTHLPPLQPPLRVLLLISSPPQMDDWYRIDIESERTAVENATREIREVGLLHLLVEDIVTPRRVQQLLLSFNPHLVHYIGHGNYDKDSGGYLVWEDEQGEPLHIFHTRLAELMRLCELRGLLLHGCQTAKSGDLTEFQSLAGSLIGVGIPAVLAQQASFTYESSQRASEMFYTALTNRQGLAGAVFEMRQALVQANQPDWAVPTLQATAGGLGSLLEADTSAGTPDPALIYSMAATDLPTPAGIFVGRQRELRALRGMLESAPGTGPMLALITGPGGIGKSTLATQAVIRYGGRYKATLTLRCAAYQGMDLFLRQIGEFLQSWGTSKLLEQTLPEARFSQETKIQAAIEELNRVGPFVLIIDNLESVQREGRRLEDSALLQFLQKLLTDLNDGRVLVTGRYTVEDLIPGGNLLQLSLDDLSPRETLQLLDRHQSLRQFGDTVREEMVQAFGGLPYIYDLLSSEAASENLTELLHDAQGRITRDHEQRVAAEWQHVRQQAIEFAALGAVASALSDKARALLAKLSLFRNAFPLGAVELGLGGSPTDWQPLIDWGLLRYNPMKDTYHLHSLTAHYAEGLLNIIDRAATQLQIGDWYLNRSREGVELVDALEAHYYFSAAGELQRAGQLANDIADSLSRLGLYQLWQKLCTMTIGTLDSQSITVAEAQRQLGMIAEAQGHYKEAQQQFKMSLSIFEKLSFSLGCAHSLHHLGVIAQYQGQYDEARQHYNRAVAIYKQLGDQKALAGTLFQLAIIEKNQGQYDEAGRLTREALTIFEQIGDLYHQAYPLQHLGNIAYLQNQYEEAKDWYERALEASKQTQGVDVLGGVLHQLGMIAQHQGKYREARRHYEEALTIFEQLGDIRARASSLSQLATIAEKQGRHEDTRHLLSEALTIFKEIGDLHNAAKVLSHLGTIARFQGQYDEAHRLYGEALAIFKQMNNLHEYADSLYNVGTVARLQERYDEAFQRYSESLSLKQQLGDQYGCAGLLHELGIIAQHQGKYEEARRLTGEALAIFERLNDLHGCATALHHLGTIEQDQQRFDEAKRLTDKALLIFEQLNDLDGVATTRFELAVSAFREGNHALALSHLVSVLAISEKQHILPFSRVLHVLASIQATVGEVEFDKLWQDISGGQSLPKLIKKDQSRDLFQNLIAFIQASTWAEAQNILERHSELLSAEADILLEQMIAAQEDERIQVSMRGYQALLARCREGGIEIIFAQLRAEEDFLLLLGDLCQQAVHALQAGDREQREILAMHLDHLALSNLPLEGAYDFLALVAAWLRDENVANKVEKLDPQFQEFYRKMVADIESRELANDSDSLEQAMAKLARGVYIVLNQGSVSQRQQFAKQLIAMQSQLPEEGRSIGTFLGCLIALLHGEDPDISTLEEPYTTLWKQLQNAIE